MSKLIAENLIVYKIRSEDFEDFDEKTLKEHDTFVTGSGGPVVYCILQNSKSSELLDKLSEGKIKIDKLFFPDIKKAKKLNNLLEINTTYEIPPITKIEIRKDVEDSFRDILGSEMDPADLERYSKEILDLSKAVQKTHILMKEGILFISQLTENGWVYSHHLYGDKISISARRQYENYNLVKTKTFGTSQMFFAKLTKRGKQTQEDILEKYKNS